MNVLINFVIVFLHSAFYYIHALWTIATYVCAFKTDILTGGSPCLFFSKVSVRIVFLEVCNTVSCQSDLYYIIINILLSPATKGSWWCEQTQDELLNIQNITFDAALGMNADTHKHGQAFSKPI